MAKNTSKLKINPQALEQATSWFVDFSEGEVDARGREAFNAWLRVSPEHVRAYLQISAFWEDADLLSRDGAMADGTLLSQALAEGNVVALGAEIQPPPQPQPARRRRAVSFSIAASIAAVVVAVAMGVWIRDLHIQAYATDTGEQRSLTLADGSTVELNSRSKIEVRFTGEARSVELLKGQALFTVAHNPQRPFVVHSGSAQVRAVGTQFDVYEKASGTVVTVLEGSVAVSSAANSSLLSVGQQLVVRPRVALVPVAANVAAATAWTQKKLIFERTPLREVVEEFNRYNHKQISLDDPALDNFHVSGVFPSADPERMIAFLRQRFDVSVSESTDRIKIATQK